jgi:hypothetical protein
MLWKQPPDIKIYEALGALADGRVEVKGTTAKVWSSSRDKYYDVIYESDTNAIVSNDNGSYWQGYLGYPSVALLAALGVITYRAEVANWLQGIPWKTMNVRFKNDYSKVEEVIREQLRQSESFNEAQLDNQIRHIAEQIFSLRLNRLSSIKKPPPVPQKTSADEN